MTQGSSEPSLESLARWLRRRRMEHEALEPLTGDVSPRRYVRVARRRRAPLVAALYPRELRGAGDRFTRSASMLAERDVRVPRILEWDSAAGIMLLEHAGERTVFDEVAPGGDRGSRSPSRHWTEAIAILDKIGGLEAPAVEALNPPLDGSVLRLELAQTRELVLEPRGLIGPRGELVAPLRTLCETLDGRPRRPCHRDFMARNLLLDSEGRLTVIDHQDLRMGPPWYDLASLLNDSLYVEPAHESAWLELAGVPADEIEDYRRAAAQRALKIAGTFVAFARRGFDRHLPLVEPSLRAARRHLAGLPETAEVLAALGVVWDRALAAA